MMKLLVKAARALYILYAFILFVVFMVPVFIWSVLVLPAGQEKAGNLTYKACMLWADVWLFFVCIRFRKVFLAPLKKDTAYIFVANHISWLDAVVIPKALRRPVKPLGMIEMTSIPVFGSIYKNVIVSVDRSSPEHRAKSVLALKAVIEHGISILVFPEGTFNTTHRPLKDFYDGAFRIAIETGTPIKPILFLDNYDRMNYKTIFSMNPGTTRCLYLQDVETSGYSINNVEMLKQEVFELMEKTLIQFNAAWIEQQEPVIN